MVATEQHKEHNGRRTPVLEAPRSSFSEILPEQEAEIQHRILEQDAFENVLPAPEMNASQAQVFRAWANGRNDGRQLLAAGRATQCLSRSPDLEVVALVAALEIVER